MAASESRVVRAILLGDDSGLVSAMNRSAGVTEDAAGRMGSSVDRATSHIGGAVSKLGNTAANLGIPFAGALQTAGKHLDDSKLKAKGFGDTLAHVGALAAGTGVAVGAAMGVASVKLAMGMQQQDSAFAAHADISVSKATQIGNAFLSTAGTSIYSGQQMVAALAPVAGQLGQIQGHALTTAQNVAFMKQATDLAEGSNNNLAATTADLSGIMQSFQIPVKGAKTAADELWNTSRVTGVGLDQLTSTVGRLHSRLGVAAPTLSDMGSMLIDLSEHGVTGSRGLMVVNTALTTLLGSTGKVDTATAKAANTYSTKMATAQNAVAAAHAKLSAAQQKESSATTVSGQASAANAVAAAQAKLGVEQQKLNTIQANGPQIANAQVAAMANLGVTVYDQQGKFVGLRNVIGQLQPKLKGMTEQQQLAALTSIFGASASKAMLATVMAGPAAYDKASSAVNKTGAAHAAAQKQAQTLNHQMKTMKASVEDIGTKLGQWLIPKLEMLMKIISKVITWFEKHKLAAEILAGIIGTVLVVAIGAFAVSMATKLVKSVGEGIKSFEKLGSKAFEMGGKLVNATSSAAGKIGDLFKKMAGKTAASMAEMEGAEVEQAAVAEETGAASSMAFGPIGIAILAVVAIGYLLIKHWKDVEKFAKEIWHGVQRVFDAFWGFVKKWGPTVLKAILAPFTGGMSLLLPMIIKHWGAIEQFFKSIPGKVFHFFMAADKWLLNAGKDIIEGLAHGLEKGIGMVVKAAKKVGHAILHAVTSFFGIFSPSKVFHGIGGNLMDGLAKGIEDHQTKAHMSMKKAVAGTAAAAAGMGAAIGAIGGSMVGSTSKVETEQLVRLASTTASLDKVLKLNVAEGTRYVSVMAGLSMATTERTRSESMMVATLQSADKALGMFKTELVKASAVAESSNRDAVRAGVGALGEAAASAKHIQQNFAIATNADPHEIAREVGWAMRLL